MQNHLHGCEDLEVKEEKGRPDEDWFSLVDAEKERSFQSHTYLVILRARTLKLQSLSVLGGCSVFPVMVQ